MDSAAQDRRTWGWGLLASFGLHGMVGLVLLQTFGGSLPAVPSQAIEVELLPAPSPPASVPHQSASLSLPKAGDVASVPDASHAPPPGAAVPAMVTASRILSDAVLAAPRSRKGTTLLAQLAPSERSEQLCGLEAMAQVGAWDETFKPDQVVAYAMGEPGVSGQVIVADGAALHSRNGWYRLAFKCELTPDLQKVTAFAFHVGAAIPRRDWDSHNLPAGDGPVE